MRCFFERLEVFSEHFASGALGRSTILPEGLFRTYFLPPGRLQARAVYGMTPRLSLRNITKRYPGIVANDDVTLEIAPGEVLAILGENAPVNPP